MPHFTKTLLGLSIPLAITACGGSSSNNGSANTPAIPTTPSNPITPTQPITPNVPTTPTVTLTASLVGQNQDFTWEQEKPISVTLKDQDNQPVAIKSCISDNITRLTVAEDCHALTIHRLGNSTLTVTGVNNISTKLTVNGVPSKSPLPVNSTGLNIANRLVNTDGTVLTWGSNYNNQLGTEDTNTVAYTQFPKTVKNLSNIYQIAHGYSNSYALDSKGQVYGWGHQVNNATQSNQQSVIYPEPVMDATNTKPLTNIVRLANASDFGGAGVTDESKVLQWGFSSHMRPEYVLNNDGTPLNNILSVAMTYVQAYAVTKDGKVLHWDLDQNSKMHPISEIKDKNGNAITNVVKVVTSDLFTLALTKTGEVYAWGETANGKLGDPDTLKSDKIDYANLVKLQAQPLSNIKDIAINFGSGYALTQSGNVHAWGLDVNGELGDGKNNPLGNATSVPSLVVNEGGTGILSDIVALTASKDSILALKSDGSMVGWGNNWHGILTQDNSTGSVQYRYPVIIQSSKNMPLKIDVSQFTQIN